MGFHPWLIMGNPVGVFNCPQSKSTGAARGYLWEFPSGKPVKLQRSLTIHGFYPWFSMGFPSGKTRLSPSGAFFSTGAARGYVWDFPSGNPLQPQRGFPQIAMGQRPMDGIAHGFILRNILTPEGFSNINRYSKYFGSYRTEASTNNLLISSADGSE